MKSLKTSIAGIVAILTTIGSAANLLLDNDPTTNPDWNIVAVSLTTAFGLLFARDHSVTSEQAGLKKEDS